MSEKIFTKELYVQLGAALVATTLLFSCIFGGDKDRSKLPKTGNRIGAYVAAQMFVENRLKCPRTAKWPFIDSDTVTTDMSNGCYVVNSYVDSENSFGAMLRTHFYCELQYAPENDSYTLKDLRVF